MSFDAAKTYPQFAVGYEMFRQAMTKGETPPRVPVFAQHHEFSLRRFGLTCREFYQDPELMVHAQLETCAEFGFDVPTVDWDYYNLEAEAIGQVIVFAEDSMPDVDRTRPLIASEADIDRIATPDFATAGRCRDIVRLIDMTAQKTGLPPSLTFCGPFSLAANVRGIERLILDMHASPDFAHEIYRRIVDRILAPWIEYVANTFSDLAAVSGADATASVPILSPAMVRDWVIPYIDRLRSITRRRIGIPNWVGEAHLRNPDEFMDMKLEVIGRYVEGQDPDVEKLGPAYYVEYAARHDVPLVLGVGAAFLAQAGPVRVHERVRHYVQTGMQHDRFALYLCNLGALTPEANVRAAVDAVRSFGTCE